MKATRAFVPFWKSSTLALLCVLTWTSVARAGGTIYNPTQADLEAALAGGGTATFACSGTIVLTNTITISADTILDGNGYAMTISGGNAVRIFQVAPGVSFWIKSLTLSDGHVVGANGVDGAPPSPGQDAIAGAILSQGGTLTLTDCVISHNTVQAGNGGNQLSGTIGGAVGGAAFGGAIYASGGHLNMTNCTVFGNTLASGRGTPGGVYAQGFEAGDAGDAAGGAVYLLNVTAALQNVVASGNAATGGVATVGYHANPYGIGSRGGTAAGGAIYATNSTVTLRNSTLSANFASGGRLTGGTSQSFGRGSGAGLGAGLFLSDGSLAAIQTCILVGNVGTGGSGAGYASGGAGFGGAVYNLGSLQVSDTRFTTNQCFSAGSFVQTPARGGAIYSGGDVMINRCTLNGNVATGGPAGVLPAPSPGEGGAIWSSGSLSATNCTFTTNVAFGGPGEPGPGGGLTSGGPGRGGAIMTYGGGTLINLSLSGNNAVSQIGEPGAPLGPAQGGGLAVTNTPPTLRGTILANSANGSNVWGVVTDAGYNICSDGSAGFTAIGSLNNTEPLLDVLADNGGPTPTMALLAGSPAIDRIPFGYPPTDQRGLPRPYGFGADAGAFESQTLIGPPPPPPLLSISVAPGGPGIYRAVISFSAQAGVVYRLLSSADLAGWASVATNSTPTSGQLQFVQNIQLGHPDFYRVVTP